MNSMNSMNSCVLCGMMGVFQGLPLRDVNTSRRKCFRKYIA